MSFNAWQRPREHFYKPINNILKLLVVASVQGLLLPSLSKGPMINKLKMSQHLLPKMAKERDVSLNKPSSEMLPAQNREPAYSLR